MSRMLRMTYGHGGTRLARILVNAPHSEYVPPPRWLQIVLLVVWVAVPVLVSLYAVPTATQQVPTMIDVSRLQVQPPPERKPEVVREEARIKPVNPVAKAEKRAVPPPAKPVERPVEAKPEEERHPAITRPAGAAQSAMAEYQPRIARERSRVETETGPTGTTRIKREGAPSALPSERITIGRSRGVVAIDSPAGRERVAALRSVPAAEGAAGGVGEVQRPSARRERAFAPAGGVEGGGSRVYASRERGTPGGSGQGEAPSAVGLSRGISLMSLEICSSPGEEEDDIRAVLGVIGSRRTCRDEKGEFQFRGTKRISSFNLIIFPAKGRRPTNRCEELEYAYKCLKSN
ncbi:MAG TPA: hypothetical protein VF799_11630 [Geobacteraceae bacterium]